MTHIIQNSLIDAYVLMAWEAFRGENPKGGRYPSIHTVWTPFNKLFRKLFSETDPVDYINMLEDKGLVTVVPAKGGVLIKPAEAFLKPAPTEHKETIAMIGRLLADTVATQKKRKEEAKIRKDWEIGNTREVLKQLGY